MEQTSHFSLPDRRKFKLIGIFVALFVVAFGGGLALAMLGARAVTIPQDIKNKADFTLFAPRELPSGFTVVESSFTVQEGAVIFQATNGSGGTITFAEQKRPDNFDFDTFYRTQLKDVKHLDGTPHDSVVGKATQNDSQVLSVVTNGTWLLITSTPPLGEDASKRLVGSLLSY